MTEEQIRKIIETDHFDSTKIKQLIALHDAEMVDILFKVGNELRDKRHEVITTLRSSVVNWNDIVEIFDRNGIDLVDKVEF